MLLHRARDTPKLPRPPALGCRSTSPGLGVPVAEGRPPGRAGALQEALWPCLDGLHVCFKVTTTQHKLFDL